VLPSATAAERVTDASIFIMFVNHLNERLTLSPNSFDGNLLSQHAISSQDRASFAAVPVLPAR
jgi:hypothetical protein